MRRLPSLVITPSLLITPNPGAPLTSPCPFPGYHPTSPRRDTDILWLRADSQRIVGAGRSRVFVWDVRRGNLPVATADVYGGFERELLRLYGHGCNLWSHAVAVAVAVAASRACGCRYSGFEDMPNRSLKFIDLVRRPFLDITLSRSSPLPWLASFAGYHPFPRYHPFLLP